MVKTAEEKRVDGVIAEAERRLKLLEDDTPSPLVLIAELNLEILKELRQQGRRQHGVSGG